VGARIDLEPLILAVEGDFRRLRDVVMNDGRLNVEKSFSFSDQLTEVLSAERASCRKKGNHFEKIRLTLCIIAPNDIAAGRELDFRFAKIAKIA
jgi:hypothetical protein